MNVHETRLAVCDLLNQRHVPGRREIGLLATAIGVKHDRCCAIEHRFVRRPFLFHQHDFHTRSLLQKRLHDPAAAEVVMVPHFIDFFDLSGDEDNFDALSRLG